MKHFSFPAPWVLVKGKIRTAGLYISCDKEVRPDSGFIIFLNLV